MNPSERKTLNREALPAEFQKPVIYSDKEREKIDELLNKMNDKKEELEAAKLTGNTLRCKHLNAQLIAIIRDLESAFDKK